MTNIKKLCCNYSNNKTKNVLFTSNSIDVGTDLTPYKYNGGQLYTNNTLEKPQKPCKYCISVDWLEVNFCGSFFLSKTIDDVPDAFYDLNEGELCLKQLLGGSKHFQYRYEVFFNGINVAILQCVPRSPVLDRNMIILKLKNDVLYTIGYLQILDRISQLMNITYKSITRLDIAIDGTKAMNLFQTYYKTKKYELKGKANTKAYLNSNNILTGFDVGSKSSSKRLTCYEKLSRIKKEHKNYILDYWINSGMEVGDSVTRLELKLSGKALKKIKSFDYKRLDDTTYLASIMRTMFKNWFEFVYTSKVKNISRKKVKTFIDWEDIGGVLLEKNKNINRSEIYSTKITIASLYKDLLSLKSLSNPKYKNKISSIETCINMKLDMYNLRKWYLTKKEYLEDEFKRSIRNHLKSNYDKDIDFLKVA